MASASVILATVLLLGLLGFGVAQMVMDTAHGTSLAGAVVQGPTQQEINGCMQSCMNSCVTAPGTERGCTSACTVQCGA